MIWFRLRRHGGKAPGSSRLRRLDAIEKQTIRRDRQAFLYALAAPSVPLIIGSPPDGLAWILTVGLIGAAVALGIHIGSQVPVLPKRPSPERRRLSLP